MRDPFVYLFVNEGDETGQFIFILCFPMASPAVDGAHLETRESGDGEGQAWYREGQGRRAGARHAIVGQNSWVG